LTNAGDCGGNDCVNYVGYSYWRNSNNHVGSDTMLIVITLDRARGGAGPTLFSYDKRTDQVTVVGPLFDQASPLSWATGEGWYWSATLPTKLYVNQGPAFPATMSCPTSSTRSSTWPRSSGPTAISGRSIRAATTECIPPRSARA
jgi:hypothetical protein